MSLSLLRQQDIQLATTMQRVLSLSSVNHHLICVLCSGYLIDATTISECLHSFCKSCIVRYLETSYNCPVCDSEVHKTKPLSNIKSDPTLQEIVLKLVPSLYEKEEVRRKKFVKAQLCNESDQPGPSGVDLSSSDGHDSNNNDDDVFVTLKYFRGASRYQKADKVLSLFPTRYLCCPRNLPVVVLKKFIRMKFDLPDDWLLEVWKTDEALLDNLKLTDVIRVFGAFRERTPLELQFSVTPPMTHCLSSADDKTTSPTALKQPHEPLAEPSLIEPTHDVEMSHSPQTDTHGTTVSASTIVVPVSERDDIMIDAHADSPLPVVVSSNSLVEPLPTSLQPIPSSPASFSSRCPIIPSSRMSMSFDFSAASTVAVEMNTTTSLTTTTTAIIEDVIIPDDVQVNGDEFTAASETQERDSSVPMTIDSKTPSDLSPPLLLNETEGSVEVSS